MTSPRPIALTSVAEASYSGPAPQPIVAVGGIPVSTAVAALVALADPATATAPEIAAKVNEIIAALKA